MHEQLAAFVMRSIPDARDVEIIEFAPIPGGFSRETYRFDARVRFDDREEVLPFILRKDPPKEAAILHTSRAVEHHLIEAVRQHTTVPVSRSYGFELDPAAFGEAAMLIERMHGSGQTSNLFNGGPDEHQVDDVVRHLCEVLVALHEADIASLDPHGALADPRGVGVDASSWDSYMDTTLQY
jgi:aminoglycoside phosphotransferase (APT) family kinase protein